MKIFGIKFVTKKELKRDIAKLENVIVRLEDMINRMRTMFPFDIGQTVYDVQLKDKNGKYTKKKPSLEHSLINEVVVSEKNYFGLVKRYKNHDVFLSSSAANRFLSEVCVEEQ